MLAQAGAPPARGRAGHGNFQQRMYQSAKASRLTSGWTPSNSSSDAELVTSLTTLRSRSRALIRDSSYAKRAQVLVVNNVVGTGIGMQAQVHTTRDELNRRVNDDIEENWEIWSEAENCHTGGRLHFKSLERQVMGQVFAAGEVIIRKHYRPFGRAGVPFSLELIEAERIADELQFPGMQATANGGSLRMGIEVDRYFRPVAYYIRRHHPSEVRWSSQSWDQVERVPADQIIHMAGVDRWPQTRGEPWLHTVARRLNDMDGYSEAEVIRARAQAVRMGIIETPNDAMSFGEEQEDGSVEMELESGIVTRLNPGEKWIDSAPSAPNPQLDAFMRYMLREISAGTGPSYASLSRDYSQSTYSSERVAQLDDRDLWRVFQAWFICDFRHKIHREWLQQAVLARVIQSVPVEQYATEPRKFEAVRFKPRGWSWVDPTKEVEAFKEAIKGGLTTVTDVVAATSGGQDIEDVLETRAHELKLMREQGLVFDTSPEIYEAEAKDPGKPPAPKPEKKPADESTENPPERRVSSNQETPCLRESISRINGSVGSLSSDVQRIAALQETSTGKLAAIAAQNESTAARISAAEKQRLADVADMMTTIAGLERATSQAKDLAALSLKNSKDFRAAVLDGFADVTAEVRGLSERILSPQAEPFPAVVTDHFVAATSPESGSAGSSPLSQKGAENPTRSGDAPATAVAASK